MLHGTGCAVVGEFSEGRGTLDWLSHNHEIDALFLDIRMPNLDGMAVLKALRGRVPVVVTTAFPDYAVDSFDYEAVDYLVKPFTPSRLQRALRRIRAKQPASGQVGAGGGPMRYPIDAGEGVVLVDLNKTTHFEVDNEVVWAYAGGRLKTLWTSLSEVEAALPGAGLLRVHRHLLLRPEAVVGIRPTPGGRVAVRLAGGVEVETSRGGTPRLKERLGL